MLDDYLQRILGDQRDPDSWHGARKGRLGASDAASFAKIESVQKYGRAKLMPSWEGGLFSNWGHEREPVILAEHGWEQNHFFIGAAENMRFGATPDGIDAVNGRLAQVKTSMHELKRNRHGELAISPAHLRQMWWEQFVMGPEYTETDYIHEHYTLNAAGEPVPDFEAVVITVPRNEEAIRLMKDIATEVLIFLDDAGADF